MCRSYLSPLVGDLQSLSCGCTFVHSPDVNKVWTSSVLRNVQTWILFWQRRSSLYNFSVFPPSAMWLPRLSLDHRLAIVKQHDIFYISVKSSFFGKELIRAYVVLFYYVPNQNKVFLSYLHMILQLHPQYLISLYTVTSLNGPQTGAWLFTQIYPNTP